MNANAEKKTFTVELYISFILPDPDDHPADHHSAIYFQSAETGGSRQYNYATTCGLVYIMVAALGVSPYTSPFGFA